MKKSLVGTLLVTVLTAGCFFSATNVAQAQSSVRAGIKGGFNASTLSTNIGNNRHERYGFHAGVFAQIPAGDFFAIQPELLYTTKGASADYDLSILRGRNTFRLNYAELPVMATFKLGRSVELQAGPYAAYLLNASVATEGDFGSGSRNLDRNDFNRLDYGLGAGLNVYFGKVFIGTRYSQGLHRIAENPGAQIFLGNAKNAVGTLSIGYSL